MHGADPTMTYATVGADLRDKRDVKDKMFLFRLNSNSTFSPGLDERKKINETFPSFQSCEEPDFFPWNNNFRLVVGEWFSMQMYRHTELIGTIFQRFSV